MTTNSLQYSNAMKIIFESNLCEQKSNLYLFSKLFRGYLMETCIFNLLFFFIFFIFENQNNAQQVISPNRLTKNEIFVKLFFEGVK